jgi:RNA polymerase sigma-70 factor (ECF subfamily)
LRYETEAGMAALESDPSKDTSTLVEREQQRQRVRLVLASMKSRSAQVLILRYSGLSYEEIADALQVSAGSIGTLLARAEKEFEKRYRDADNR